MAEALCCPTGQQGVQCTAGSRSAGPGKVWKGRTSARSSSAPAMAGAPLHSTARRLRVHNNRSKWLQDSLKLRLYQNPPLNPRVPVPGVLDELQRDAFPAISEHRPARCTGTALQASLIFGLCVKTQTAPSTRPAATNVSAGCCKLDGCLLAWRNLRCTLDVVCGRTSNHWGWENC